LCEKSLSEQDWQNVGKALGTMHNCQVYHHDANVRNIMMDDEHHVWLIDFDRCYQRTGNTWKKQNLARLLRSLHKEKAKNPIFHWQPEQWQSFIDGYNAVSNTTA
jgi:3-deoxy-D-manno-octulosonic acid kinase